MINLQTRLDTVRQDMHVAYGHAFSTTQIDAKVDEVIERHLATSTVEDFIPVLVEREVSEFFGSHRIHVRFSAGANHHLAAAAVALTRRYAGDALVVDAAVAHPENDAEGHMAHVLSERGLGEGPERYFDEARTIAMPDFIVYLGRDIAREEAGKDIKIWDIAPAATVEETRELADDLEARVLYMLGKLGIEPVREGAALSA